MLLYTICCVFVAFSALYVRYTIKLFKINSHLMGVFSLVVAVYFFIIAVAGFFL